jgi:hypothetical protein
MYNKINLTLLEKKHVGFSKSVDSQKSDICVQNSIRDQVSSKVDFS